MPSTANGEMASQQHFWQLLMSVCDLVAVLEEWEWRPDPENALREAVPSCAAMTNAPALLGQPLLSKASGAHGGQPSLSVHGKRSAIWAA